MIFSQEQVDTQEVQISPTKTVDTELISKMKSSILYGLYTYTYTYTQHMHIQCTKKQLQFTLRLLSLQKEAMESFS